MTGELDAANLSIRLNRRIRVTPATGALRVATREPMYPARHPS